MKNLIAFVFLMSTFSAFSLDGGVLDAMKSMFRAGLYTGVTPAEGICTVRFEYLSDRAIVTAATEEISVERIVPAKSTYRFRPGRRELLSSDNQSTFRSLAVDETHTYTVTSEINEYGEEVPVECIISL
jgi:hypothetical protein